MRPQDFEPLAIADHPEALKGDVARLLASPLLPGGTVVAGLLYDLRSGRLDVVEPAAAV